MGKILCFKPESVNPDIGTPDAFFVDGYKAMAATAVRFIEENKEKRRAAGKVDVWTCCAVHRKTKDVRFFNFEPKYKGRLNHAECMFNGEWRLASFAEEDAEYKRQRDFKVKAAQDQLELQGMANKAAISNSPANMAALDVLNNARKEAESMLAEARRMLEDAQKIKAEAGKQPAPEKKKDPEPVKEPAPIDQKEPETVQPKAQASKPR